MISSGSKGQGHISFAPWGVSSQVCKLRVMASCGMEMSHEENALTSQPRDMARDHESSLVT